MAILQYLHNISGMATNSSEVPASIAWLQTRKRCLDSGYAILQLSIIKGRMVDVNN